MSVPVDLSSLPVPVVIEDLDFEAVVARQKAKFQEIWTAVRLSNPELALPEYDVSMLETDPVTVIIEAESYREVLLRARVNDAARSNLLKFSVGPDLDHLAADHGVARLADETDAALRSRVVLADQGRSSAGPEEWYKYHARSASPAVRDAAVYRRGAGPEIEVAILAQNDGGVPSAALLATVEAVVTSSSVRSINDIVTVVAGTKMVLDVAADIWLLPETPVAVFEGLETRLRLALDSEGGFGFDINESWLKAKLMAPGVANVVIGTPAGDMVMADNAAATFGAVTLTLKGRSR